jgi:hypothetical protein
VGVLREKIMDENKEGGKNVVVVANIKTRRLALKFTDNKNIHDSQVMKKMVGRFKTT